MTYPTKYKPEYCQIAAQVLAGGESLAAVCAELEISRPTLNTWREMHPEFENAVSIGLAKSQRDWERLGKQGICGEFDKFSASPWIFTMKNRFRDDYAEEKNENNGVPEAVVMQLIDRLVE